MRRDMLRTSSWILFCGSHKVACDGEIIRHTTPGVPAHKTKNKKDVRNTSRGIRRVSGKGSCVGVGSGWVGSCVGVGSDVVSPKELCVLGRAPTPVTILTGSPPNKVMRVGSRPNALNYSGRKPAKRVMRVGSRPNALNYSDRKPAKKSYACWVAPQRP